MSETQITSFRLAPETSRRFRVAATLAGKSADVFLCDLLAEWERAHDIAAELEKIRTAAKF